MKRRDALLLGTTGFLGITSLGFKTPWKQSKDNKMKTLGMIGGTSWHSTIDYYRYINELVNERIGVKVSPQLLISSINIAIMHEGDWNKITQKFLEDCRMLEKAGADGIIFCANTTHKVYPDVQPNIGIPIIHMADAIVDEAKSSGLENLGLLGTKYVMEEDFMAERIRKTSDINLVIPKKERFEPIHEIIAGELVKGVFTQSSKDFFIAEMDGLKAEGANGIILGCTELPMLIKADDYDLPLLDTTLIHSKKAVDFILS